MDSLIAWVGGKKQLRKTISELIPKDINGYIEAFGGAGWVMFFKDKWANLEVYNDLDSRLVNLFKIVKYHPEELARELDLAVSSRDLFKEFKEHKGMTDIQRAARFLYLIKRSFGSKASHFGTSRYGGGAAFTSHHQILSRIQKLHDRLDKVVIENLDFEKLFEIYDDKNNFFYCDPPYRIGDQYIVGKMDYERLKRALKKLKGRFLLSLDNCPENIELFNEFKIIEIERVNGINRKLIKNNIYKELLIKNY